MINKVNEGIIFVPFMTGKGGTERVIQNLFQALNKQPNSKLNMTVYSIGGSDDYDWTRGVPVNITSVSKNRKIRTLYYLFCLPFIIFSIIKKNKPKFVISTNPIMWFLAKLCARILKLDTVIISWYHYSLKQKPVKSLLLKSADYYLAISSGIKQQLVSNGVDSNKISLVYNPVTDPLNFITRPKEDTRFLYIGRLMLDGQKNIRELFLALSKVKGNWSIDLIGDNFKNDNLKGFANDLHINGRIRWQGFSKHPWNEISETTALVLTSKYEGLPMVLCEAIMRGVYCVSADIETGPRDIINMDNGELYESGNTKQLTAILQSLLDGKQLPSEQEIHDSARKFEPSVYANNFEKSILRSINNNNEVF